MRELNSTDTEIVSGGLPPLVILGYVLTAVAISDFATDFVKGYNAAMAD